MMTEADKQEAQWLAKQISNLFEGRGTDICANALRLITPHTLFHAGFEIDDYAAALKQTAEEMRKTIGPQTTAEVSRGGIG